MKITIRKCDQERKTDSNPTHYTRGAQGGGRGGGRPPRGLGVGRLGSGHPQKSIQSPDGLYKAPKRLYKDIQDYTKTQNIRQNLKVLNKYPKYLTRVAPHINLT